MDSRCEGHFLVFAHKPAVDVAIVGEEQRVEHEEAIYCIVYELVNNAVKNADAEHIRVQLMVDKQTMTVNVSDDGKGGIVKDGEGGSGLRNIRDRVEAIGGRVDVYSKPGEGSEIMIEFDNDRKNG